MTKTIDQNAVDERIHHFMARKSPWKTFSQTVAEWLASPLTLRSKNRDISYERTGWTGGRAAPSH